MKQVMMLVLAIFMVVSLSSCASRAGSAALGVIGGAAVGAGGYEYHFNNEKKQIEADYKAGKIDKKEYDIRLDQINRDSILK